MITAPLRTPHSKEARGISHWCAWQHQPTTTDLYITYCCGALRHSAAVQQEEKCTLLLRVSPALQPPPASPPLPLPSPPTCLWLMPCSRPCRGSKGGIDVFGCGFGRTGGGGGNQLQDTRERSMPAAAACTIICRQVRDRQVYVPVIRTKTNPAVEKVERKVLTTLCRVTYEEPGNLTAVAQE